MSNAAVSPPPSTPAPHAPGAAPARFAGRGVDRAVVAAAVAALGSVVVAAVAATLGATGVEDSAAAAFVACLALTGALGLFTRVNGLDGGRSDGSERTERTL